MNRLAVVVREAAAGPWPAARSDTFQVVSMRQCFAS